MYPETPGAPVLVLGAPVFPVAQFNVPGRPPVTVTAPGASTSSYVQGVSVDGRPTPDAWLPAPPSYQAGPLEFPAGRQPVVLVPSGPNLFGSTPTGQLDWQGPVENGVGSIPGTITPTVTPQGASAVEWTEPNADPDSWIWVDPTTELTGDNYYQVSITVQGTGDVYLDFWTGQQDLTSEPVQLTSTPQTFTTQAEVPATADTHLQVRTASAGPVDLYASAASIQLLTAQASSSSPGSSSGGQSAGH
jgi:hypothetical protein